MPLTNGELVRREVGDGGAVVRDTADGDASSKEFYLSVVPILGNSQTIAVGGSTYAEVPSSPGASQYTLDDITGLVTFGVAPGSGTANIVAVYRGVAVPDADITEACRQYGLTATANAETGMPVDILNAAALVCDWRASAVASEFDFETDGQSFKRGSLAAAWAARAEAIRERVRRRYGLVSTQTSRIDGYARRGEYAGREYQSTATNPRRQFYRDDDRVP